jgi:UDP-N-acetylmuramate--alanine ligase
MIADNIRSIYFLGIGGIGMSALARYFKALGMAVSGYDRTPTALTSRLVAEGIPVHFEDRPDLIPPDTDMVIYTPAIPPDHAEFRHLATQGIPLHKRSEVLGMIAQGMFTIAVAGTHGKTTISSMIAWILKTAGRRANAFIGGISVNLDTNLLMTPDAELLVAEADEYDRSFLTLFPDIAVVSSTDADHLDIYQTHQNLQDAFQSFCRQIRENGFLICRSGLNLSAEAGITKYTYGVDAGDFYASGVQIKEGHFIFDLHMPGIIIPEITLLTPGRHHIENALAAAAVCYALGISGDIIQTALQSYAGVKRRFEIQVPGPEVFYIDDYAHHPQEIEACIRTARELFPGKKIAGVFQPHLFSRTRDLAEGFSAALGMLDALVLLPVYPAREKPVEGVTSEMLFAKINMENKQLATKSTLSPTIANMDFDVLITMGAGDIDMHVQEIRELLQHINNKPAT